MKNEQFLIRTLCYGSQYIIRDPEQLKMARKLLKLYPKLAFWSVVELPYKPQSLDWFFTADGKEFLLKQYALSKFEEPPKEKIEISNKPVDNTPIDLPPRKPKSVIDFLKYGKT